MIDSALALIESVSQYKVLLVGEDIRDEYHYVIPLGKSPKEYLIPVRYKGLEVFQGGVVAAARHLRTFCNTVEIRKAGPTITKARFVDHIENRKLFEVQYDHEGLNHDLLEEGYDAYVVTDFGHERISGDLIEKLCKLPYLAVATQTNSSNIGYNLVTKYPRADYIVIDEPEARLAAADRHGTIQSIMERLSFNRCGKFIVTHGKYGAYGYHDGYFKHLPAFQHPALDNMGAGDAFFSITAPMAKTGGIDDLLLIGNAAGALKCGIWGHREPVTKKGLIEFLRESA